MKKRIISSVMMAVLWLILLAAVIGGTSYAWFTFHPITNVEPMSGTVSDGETTLLISDRKDGSFSASCLLPQLSVAYQPVSTADLNAFYEASSQNRKGIITAYRNVTDSLENKALHGRLYLQSYKDNCLVYFNRSGMDFGVDTQTLAALRLGIRITTTSEKKDYIFALNDMGNTSAAEAVLTIPETGKIVAGINNDQSAVYVYDVAKELRDYFAVFTEESKTPKQGVEPLCILKANEVATVEYWLYLEGCDENCTNGVQSRDVTLQLSFAGVSLQ